jgi:hypothetical protein
MTKFNLREAIAKNKATFFSSLNENVSDTAEKFAKHMSKKENRKFTVTPGSVDEKSFDLDIDGLEYEGGSYLIDDKGDIINVSMGNKVYGNINQLEEEDSMKNEGKKEYYRDAEADDAEHIKALEKDMKDDKKSSKMKKSELKAKIKEMVLAEMNLDIQDTTSEYDFLAEKKEDEEDVEVEDTEVDIDGMEDIDVDTTSEVDPDIKAVQDLLTQAQAAAQALGDEKLTDQIGNTITFFTRTHVVDKGAVAEGETTNINEYYTSTIGERFLESLGYEDYNTFFLYNPGAFENLVDWAMKRKEFAQKLKDLDNDKGAVAEGLNEAKSLLFSFDYNTDEDDVDYIQGLLKDARVDAIAQPGLESGEMIVKAKNEVELRKAKKVIQANGFKIYKSVEEGKEMVNEAEGKLVDEKTGEEVTLPYKTLDFRGNPITVVSFRAPHKSSSTGRIYTKDNGEYFPGVAGLKIIDHSFSENLNESMFPMLKKILK